MVSSLVLFFAFVVIIGGAFFRLAKRFHKNKWLYFFIGIGTYFTVSALIKALIGVLSMYLFEPSSYQVILLLNFSSTAIGILTCVYLHKRLEKQWKLNGFVSETDVLDDNLNQEIKPEN